MVITVMASTNNDDNHKDEHNYDSTLLQFKDRNSSILELLFLIFEHKEKR